MFSVSSKGDFKRSKSYLTKILRGEIYADLSEHGRRGVIALAQATPEDSGETASSWDFRIIRSHKTYGVEWFNTHIVDGAPIAILLQYGHATGTGGYVRGRDYINPAIQPIFDQIARDVEKRVRMT